MSEMNIEVGKFTLESLTTGMYSDPQIVYREYIQNSVDALEYACEQGIIERQGMRIDILVDKAARSIIIRDNGAGIEKDKAQATLLNIGSSSKRHSKNRGFRGIGRLGGMSYCNTLIFTTSAENEAFKTQVTFDCKRLKELLVPGEYEKYDLAMVIEEITQVDVLPEDEEKHYFWVQMLEVDEDSDLLELPLVRDYIAQVAPVPYKSRYFYHVKEINDFCALRSYTIDEFPVFLGDSEVNMQPVYKPNRNRFHADRSKMKVDEITKIHLFDIVIEDELYAIGWYADCNWLGTLSEPEISGMRVRKGNILIGDARTLNSIYREQRFNGWVQGELFVVTDKLVPNARRDDFEQNDAYKKLMRALYDGIGYDITKTIREASAVRNNPSARIIQEVQSQVREATETIEEGFNSSVDKGRVLEQLEKSGETLRRTKVGEDLQGEKERLQHAIEEALEDASSSSNYKINRIKAGMDRKSKKMLEIVSDILSLKLSKFLVDEILEEIIEAINRK